MLIEFRVWFQDTQHEERWPARLNTVVPNRDDHIYLPLAGDPDMVVECQIAKISRSYRTTEHRGLVFDGDVIVWCRALRSMTSEEMREGGITPW